MSILRFDEAWGADVEKRVTEMLEEQFEALDREDEDAGGEAEIPATPSGLLFCGCDVCVTRETIYLVTLLALSGHQEGLVEVVDS